jgi:hypothetical protein
MVSISISDAQDDCLRFLKENPNRIEMFESFPIN